MSVRGNELDVRALKEGVEPVQLENTGGRGALFGLTFGRMLLTVLTLGIARFWMVTRLRKFHWSAFRLDGEPFEYTGRPVEKLIGFLIAVAILAVYLTVVNLALTFVGLSYFDGDAIVVNISLLAIVPLGFWAQYRARRYILARTRWRGIRFGAEHGAWSYMLRAIGLWLLTLATLGLTYPYQQMTLARFTTDRTWFGNLRFTQYGSTWPLFRSWLFVIAPLLIVAAFGLYQWHDVWAELQTIELLGEDGDISAELGADQPVLSGLASFAGLTFLWGYIFYLRHSIFSFRYLNSHKVLADETTFEFRLGFWQVVGVYILGSLIIAILSTIILTTFGMFVGMFVYASGIDPAHLEGLMEGDIPFGEIAFLIGTAAIYLFAIVAIISLSQAFITLPIMRLIAHTTEVYGLENLSRAQQRARDEQVEAGGFADALGADVGGAF